MLQQARFSCGVHAYHPAGHAPSAPAAYAWAQALVCVGFGVRPHQLLSRSCNAGEPSPLLCKVGKGSQACVNWCSSVPSHVCFFLKEEAGLLALKEPARLLTLLFVVLLCMHHKQLQESLWMC